MEKLVEAFHELLDQLFWSGYAENLLKTDPESYKWELAEFTKMYG